jgi:hypothetical protein
MSAKKQSKDKRACVDCHFVALRQLKWEGLSTPTDTEGPYELGVLQREQVRKKEDVTVKWDNLYKPDTKLVDSEHILACYQDVWDEFNENFTIKHRGMVDPKFRYRILVEEDRSNCIKFFMYTPSMSFEAAEEQRKAELLQSQGGGHEGSGTNRHNNELQEMLSSKIPPDTKWPDIEMSLTDKEYKTLDISVKGGKPFNVNCREMGLESNHSHKPLKAWWILIALAKSKNNEIPSSGKKLMDFAVSVKPFVPNEGGTLFSHIDKLRTSLSKAFGIDINPIPHVEESGVYQSLFRIKDKSYTEEHEKSAFDSEGIKCDKCGGLIKKYDHSNIDDEGNYLCYNCKGTSHDRLSSEDRPTSYSDGDEWN